jgi:isopenicillin N synthase-like dioxygenase
MTFLTTLKSLSCLGSAKSRRSQDPDQQKPHTSENGSTSNSNASSSTAILPPLRPTTLPRVLPLHQPALASQGWTTITYPAPNDPLLEASQALFRASKAFFALPSSYKEGFRTKIGSEEGWSRVEGEKEFITLRGLSNTPDELKDAATAYWKEAGGLLNEILGRVAESLGMEADALTRFSEPCKELQVLRTATMLRLFRYEGFSEQESKIVAQGISAKP